MKYFQRKVASMECCDVGEVLECYETNGVQECADMHLQDMEKIHVN